MRNVQEQLAEALRQSTPQDLRTRNRQIVRASVIGIAANVLLAVFKAIIGALTHSIAISLDAVNNLTDAGSSVITIVGTKLASRKPDKQHPYGHGRIEYLSAMMLGAIVMAAGISSLIEAIRKIVRPQTPEYTAVSLAIVGICVLVKIFLGRYVTAAGERLNSQTLVNSGKDATMDAVISATTIIAALVYIITGVSLEAWLGALISVFIIRAAAEMLLSTLSELLGQRADADFSRAIRKTVEVFPEVHGVYDLMFHDYGPNRMTASLHVEVDDTMRAYEISDLIRRISMAVLEKHHVLLTAVGIYSMNTENERAVQLRNEITEIAHGYEHILQVHGFYLRDDNIQFDVIVDFETEDPRALCDEIEAKVHQRHPGLSVQTFWDADFSFSE